MHNSQNPANVVVYSMSKIAFLSQGTDCFKLTVKQTESQNERSGKREKQDCSCGHCVFALEHFVVVGGVPLGRLI